MNKYFLSYLLLFSFQFKYGVAQETPAQMTSEVNQIRATAIPQALKMTCLTWNSALATTVTSAATSCSILAGTNVAYDVRPQTGATVESFFQVINDWYSQFYDISSTLCFDITCNQYLTIMNEKANSFACSQATCAAGSIAGCTSGSCTYTVCQFDQNRSNPPYTQSSTGGDSCTDASCAASSDPTKNICANFLCCGAVSATTSTSTTTTTSKPTTTTTTTPKPTSTSTTTTTTTSKPTSTSTTTTTTTSKPTSTSTSTTTTTTTSKPTSTSTTTTTTTSKPTSTSTTTTTTKPTTPTTTTTTTTPTPTTTTTTTTTSKPTTTSTTSTTSTSTSKPTSTSTTTSTSKPTTATTSSTSVSTSTTTTSKPSTASTGTTSTTTSSSTKPTTVSTTTSSTSSSTSRTSSSTSTSTTKPTTTTSTTKATSPSSSSSSSSSSTSTTTTTSTSKATTTSTNPTTSTSKPVTIPSSSSVFCSVNGAANWWCAKDQPEGQQVSTAVAADSCFCVINQTQTQQQAFDSCTAMGGFLTDIQNSNENSLIGTILSKANIQNTNCPVNSTYFNGLCYQYFYLIKKTWRDAENFCQSTFGGHLPSIHSKDQQDLLVNLSKGCYGCPIYGFWIGANNYGSKPTAWLWSDGSVYDSQYPRLTQYRGSGWAPQPEDPVNQQCMTLVKPDGGWGDWYCSWSEPYHCQFSPSGPTALIGLQKTPSGNFWSVGTNCQMNQATYQSWITSVGSGDQSAYVYNNGMWSSISSTSTASSAVCRIDRNICGRSPCGTCNTCTSTNGGKCFNCTQSTQSSTSAPSPPSTSTTFNCGNTTTATNWFCAKSQPQGQSVTSAVAADSCFCIQNQLQNQQQALSSCQAIGGFLTDIQNADENQLISGLVANSASGTANSGQCPTGTVYYDGSCYVYVSSAKKVWQDAENYCQTTYGGHLATIYSYDQQSYLFNTISSRGTNCNIYGLWVGGYNGGDPNNWRWSDGSTFTQFPNVTQYKGWGPQPDSPKTQNCMTIVQPDGGWGDWFCNQAQPFICQFQITSFWIGLQKSASGHYWNLGSTCQMAPASYQNWNTGSDNGLNLGYTFLKTSTWNGVSMTSLASSSVCRMDRNICGRNSCPTCNQCKPTASSDCNTCSTSSTIAPSTSNVLCNTAGITTDWWCAKSNAIGQTVTSAVQADSCFCVMYQSQTQQQAFDSCAATGGFLTDIQNSAENSLISTLLQMSTSSSNLPSTACPTNSYYYNGYCYTYIASPTRAWQDAENYCQANYAGHLASIHSDDQQNFIFKNVTQNAKNCTQYGFWVGGNNYGSIPTKWLWSDGTALIQFPMVTNNTAWAPQPEDPKNQQCMTIVPYDGGWGDWYCAKLQPFVCQFPVLNNAWIGLQRTLSGHNWNTDINCQSNSATYQAWIQANENTEKTSYLYATSSSSWQSMFDNATSNAAVCRLDKNVCGRSNCPSCSTCTSLNNGRCYQCGPTSQSSTTASPSATLKTTSSFTFACNTAGTTTNWWCAKDYVEGQSVSTALAADSCYCIMNKNQTQQQAFDSCISTGGFLTDIQNSDENNLMNTLYNTAVNGPTSSGSLCPVGAVYMNGYCYIYQSTAKTWQAAETFCQTNYSGHLASIHNMAQQNLLVSISQNFLKCLIYGFWVGANNYGSTPTKWVWSDGTAFDNSTFYLTQYDGWPQQPDAPKTQQCMTIVRPDGGWADWLCSSAQPFVCQFLAVSSSPWIGLQKGLSGHSWNIGSNCQLTPALFQGWDQTSESSDKTSYTFGTGGSWSNVDDDSMSTSAICRLDRNICGRNMCPTCSTCTASSNGGCYKCA